MFVLCFLPLFTLAVMRVDNYTAFTNREVIDNPFGSIGMTEIHDYSTVAGIYEVRGYHARLEDKIAPYQLILFADGARWETRHGSGGPRLEHQREMMRFVAERSGVAFRVVNFIENIPP
jgi:hypothetical protein